MRTRTLLKCCVLNRYGRNMTNEAHTPRVWFITGASSGIGRELAVQALTSGEAVVAVARHTETLSGLAQFDRLLTIEADVRDETVVAKAVEQSMARFGRIDVVANLAGYGLFGAVEEASDTQARAIFDTNVFGVLNVLRAILPVLRSQRSGHVLQGSSYYGQTADPGVGLLAATKYAVEGLSDALAAELAPLGIHVTLVQPGLTATPFLSNLAAATATHADYDQTVRTVQQAIRALPAAAFSAVDRVAAGIRTAVASDNPPRRLALGIAGSDSMRTALTARLDNLDEWATVTSLVDAHTA
ncbi:SDR family NAD(P)-dependent oxidoreductase [Nocardia seriolae]|uniref:Cis-2,3-dihydrobiphenyl-2,3-diol dehydrogenase n=2 Tax=Nocardia seriolae TaxID=37332 RepID=A0ABC9YYH0_9NOCA|nr:SDR family NAD(P)-dependent oxidoreductase [Nocardia seriolae]BEK94320.1 oxidoreductase [Nocardia seriolae]GAM48479.1 cis-2,3-dihydrobiphenyl-2,3-diol dehydrogenase [Nocardia seriolae]GAP30393.1 cis-2,3-dihydrobiphenyl-2,3-diol dehydrogenase [Nocardia seriolae]GEM25966.1 short-chain dehydrogenase/reductase [Nocardia seriolae NBRC 15557]